MEFGSILLAPEANTNFLARPIFEPKYCLISSEPIREGAAIGNVFNLSNIVCILVGSLPNAYVLVYIPIFGSGSDICAS